MKTVNHLMLHDRGGVLKCSWTGMDQDGVVRIENQGSGSYGGVVWWQWGNGIFKESDSAYQIKTLHNELPFHEGESNG